MQIKVVNERERERERADAPLSRDSEHGHKQNTSTEHIYIAGAEEAPMYTLVPIPKLT